MNEKDNFALVPKPPSAVEKAAPGAKRILSGMAADTLALVKPVRLDSPDANAASVEALLKQGKDFYFGYGVSKSYENAFASFSKAAAADNPEAQFHVALCFEDGDGVKQDQGQAVEWYQKSVSGGFAKAQHNLAICYRDGHGVPRDHA